MNKQQLFSRAPFFLASLFLISLPFNMRHIFNFEDIRTIEGFRESSTLSLFLSDIILLLFFLVLFLISKRKKVSKESIKKIILKTIRKPILPLIFWIVFSTIWAVNKDMALISGSRILLAILVFSTIPKTLLSNRTVLQNSALIIFLSGAFQSLIAIAQFALQRSIGLHFFGESIISTSTLGVAKFEIAGTKIIRAYGFFPHPNILASFLLLSIAAGVWLLLNTRTKKTSIFFDILIPSCLFLTLVGLILTYSRSVIASFLVFLILILGFHQKEFVALYQKICKLLHIPRVLRGACAILIGFSVLFISYNTLSPRLCLRKCSNDNSIDLRLNYIKTANSTIANSPLLGTGVGNFVVFQKNHFERKINPWEQQPVHNIYLLIASEIGLIGLVFFLYFLIRQIRLFQKDFFKTFKNPFALCFFAFLALGLIDHYFWSTPQGILIFWVSLAFFLSSAKIKTVSKFAKEKNISLQTEDIQELK